jgi:LmbE family N-acetylglucosaminyl deacetylase
MAERRNLVIAAHPDDEVLGPGGTIALKAMEGEHTSVLIVSEGASAQFDGDLDRVNERAQQLQEACEILGIAHLEHWGYPDMRLADVSHMELNSRLAAYIEDNEIDTIFVHHPFDVNIDHQVVFRSVMVACRPVPGSYVRRLYTYHVNSSTEWNFSAPAERFLPNSYFDITKTLPAKLKALQVYRDELREFPHPRSLQAVEARALTLGSEVGFKAAEAFCLIYARYSREA